MTTTQVQIIHERRVIRVLIDRIHDRGNHIDYEFVETAFLGFNVEGEGTDHAYIVLYLHGGRNIRFKLPIDNSDRNRIRNDLHTCLVTAANPNNLNNNANLQNIDPNIIG